MTLFYTKSPVVLQTPHGNHTHSIHLVQCLLAMLWAKQNNPKLTISINPNVAEACRLSFDPVTLSDSLFVHLACVKLEINLIRHQSEKITGHVQNFEEQIFTYLTKFREGGLSTAFMARNSNLW